MEKARIVHCEDSVSMQDIIAATLSTRGLHRVVASAESLGGSLKHLQAIKDKKLHANVILLDGNLKGGIGLNHPLYVINRLRELKLELPVIGLSLDGLSLKGIITGRDIVADLLKEEVANDPDSLIAVLDGLPEPPKPLRRDDD